MKPTAKKAPKKPSSIGNGNIPKNQIDWQQLMQTPLTYELARIKAPRASDKRAAEQIATALHEAIHIFYGVMGNHPTEGATIPTKRNSLRKTLGIPAIGHAAVYDDNYGWYAVMSDGAAALFEWILAGFTYNNTIAHEERLCLAAIRSLYDKGRDADKYIFDFITPGQSFGSRRPITEKEEFIFETVFANAWFGFCGEPYWAVVRTIAVFLLKNRNSDGIVDRAIFDPLFRWLKNFSVFDDGLFLPDTDGVPTFQDDMEWLWRSNGVDLIEARETLEDVDYTLRKHRAFEGELAVARADMYH